MNASKLAEATQRLEVLYWDCHRNGGPDVEILSILRLVEEAAVLDADPDEEDGYELNSSPQLGKREPRWSSVVGWVECNETHRRGVVGLVTLDPPYSTVPLAGSYLAEQPEDEEAVILDWDPPRPPAA
jgi:hypothetical protein